MCLLQFRSAITVCHLFSFLFSFLSASETTGPTFIVTLEWMRISVSHLKISAVVFGLLFAFHPGLQWALVLLMFVHFVGENRWVCHHEVTHLFMSEIAG